MSIATGDFGFMDNDDELAPQALYEVVKALNTDPTIDFLLLMKIKLQKMVVASTRFTNRTGIQN